jgi:type I restriction enzyme, S subunit
MSFPRYPSYKDSGVGWLGEVPAHWFLGRAKHICSFFTGWTPPTGNSASYIGDNAWANISDLGPKWLQDTAKTISDEAVRDSDIQVSKQGSLLFSFKLSIGQVSFAGRDLYTNEAIATFPPSERLWLPYAYYALPLFLVKNASENIYGAKLLNQELMRAAPVVVPDLEEQKAIAIFLDHETAKIDTLVAEQERLIELLKEKRQAVISHAVTKGLDPSVPMKDSGVEWLGEVPAHWRVKQLRHVARIVRGASPRPAGDPRFFSSDESDDGNVPWVTVAEITKDDSLYLSDVAEFLTPLGAEASQRFESGTVIFSNSGATLGVPKILALDCCANDGVVAFRNLDQQVLREFLYFFLSTTTERLRTEMKQGGGQPNLNTDIVKCIGFAVPSLEEQGTIVKAIKRETERFNELINEARHGVDLLQERRTALISAAVTGQIDVRGWVPAEAGA